MTETTKPEKIHKTEAEWREVLTPEQFHVMREKGNRSPIHRSAVRQPRRRGVPLRRLQRSTVYLG